MNLSLIVKVQIIITNLFTTFLTHQVLIVPFLSIDKMLLLLL